MRIGDLAHTCTVTIGEFDTLDRILLQFNRSDFSLLPVIDGNGVCLGAIRLKDVESLHPSHFNLNEVMKPITIFEDRHLIEGIRHSVRLDGDGLIVIDEEGYLMGYVILEELYDHFSASSGLLEKGSMMIIESQLNSYSLTEVSKIVESNGASILHLYVSSHPESSTLQVTMILNQAELGDIITSFERFKYGVLYYSSSTDREDLMKERYDSLMNFLEI